MLVPRTSGEKLTAKVTYSGPLIAPVEQGKEVGTLRVFRGPNVILEVPLLTANAVAAGTLTQRGLDAASELGLGLFRQMIQKK